jgi:hypothetical protein
VSFSAPQQSHPRYIHRTQQRKLFRIYQPRTNIMLGNSAPYLIYTASCFEDNDHTAEDRTSGKNMMLKQPLITMSNEESLEGDRQTKLQKESQSRSVIGKSFLFDGSIGFALQVMACAAYYTLFKMFGKDTQPTTGSLLSSFSYFLLVLTSQLHLVIYFATWLTAIYTSTQSGSYCHNTDGHIYQYTIRVLVHP